MPSGAENGDVVTLKVSLSAGTLVAIAAQTDFSISYEANEIAADAKGDTAVFNLPSRQASKVSVSGLYVHSDTAQQRLITQMKINGQVTIEMMRNTSAIQSATATITRLEIVHTDKSAATYSAEFAVDGEWA